ncbi:GNAT family N-acetyltransferase [uncultured Jatrophihabitans sp.]|uniref:GNAT family N-acetyltransferase n=1 Tax=uncultured Jatrophihabitans sp. TaxID=1610747 RepID=UPI0035C9D772
MFEVEVRPYDDADVRAMEAEVQEHYVQLYGGPDGAAIDAAQFSPPAGLFLVGLLDGEPVAMGGWRRLADGSAEIKRMYVRGVARRRGLARALLAELEGAACATGIRHMVLNTGPQQPAAIAMYEAAGYRPTAAFGHYACQTGALFYRRDLTDDPDRPAATP